MARHRRQGDLKREPVFQCMECGRRFRSEREAERAARRGCAKCGSVDVDLAEGYVGGVFGLFAPLKETNRKEGSNS